MECPACGSAMQAFPLAGVELDVCGACGGTWLDPGEAEAQQVDPSSLFGAGPGAAEFDRVSERVCPRHGRNMETYVATSDRRHFEVERADCCGGLFLDSGEGVDFAAAAARATQLMRTSTPAPKPSIQGVYQGLVAMESLTPTPPQPLTFGGRSGRSCPRCGGAYDTARDPALRGLDIDRCQGCGSMFLDAGESEAAGIDTAALFGVRQDATRDGGQSSLSCPACAVPMRVVLVTWIGGDIEIDRALCCGGLYLDGGELDPLMRAGRRARAAHADEVFAKDGQYASEHEINKALASPSSVRAMTDAARRRVDSMMQQMMEDRMRYRRNW